MSAKINEINLKKNLHEFCDNEETGNVLAKLADRNVVHLETMAQTFPRIVTPTDKPGVPLVKCITFIDDLIRTNFFGEITVNYHCGKISGIGVKKIYKPRDIEKEIRGAGSAQ